MTRFLTIIAVFLQNVDEIFSQYIWKNHLKHQSYKSEHTERKYLNNIPENRILKGKSNFLRLNKFCKELKYRELKDKEIKGRSAIEELLVKLAN